MHGDCDEPNLNFMALGNYMSSNKWDYRYDPIQGNHIATAQRELTDDSCKVFHFKRTEKLESSGCCCEVVNFSNVGHCTIRGENQDPDSFFPFQCGSPQ